MIATCLYFLWWSHCKKKTGANLYHLPHCSLSYKQAFWKKYVSDPSPGGSFKGFSWFENGSVDDSYHLLPVLNSSMYLSFENWKISVTFLVVERHQKRLPKEFVESLPFKFLKTCKCLFRIFLAQMTLLWAKNGLNPISPRMLFLHISPYQTFWKISTHLSTNPPSEYFSLYDL